MIPWDEVTFNEPLSEDAEIPSEIAGVKLSEDYIEFMRKHNGCDGFTRNAAVVLFRIDELEEVNDDYGIAEYLPGSCIVGGDGAGELYGIDSAGNYFMVPTIITLEDKIVLGKTLEEFLENLDRWLSGYLLNQ